MSNSFLSILSLTDEERTNPPRMLGQLKTVTEWMSSALDAVKDNADFPKALEAISPWAGAAFAATKDAVPPIRFVVKLFEELTKVQEPEALALVACTLAYEASAEKVVRDSGIPEGAQIVGELHDSFPTEVVDFSSFTLDQAVSHPFVHQADRVVAYYLGKAGYSKSQLPLIISRIHDGFADQLSATISHGKTKDKFDPLFRWLQLDTEGRSSRAALRRHCDYVAWQFNESPVLEYEPYALAHIYVATDCGVLTREQLEEKGVDGRSARDPFSEEDGNGGRLPLLDTVLKLMESPNFREPIVIQGSAGAGKSTFTLQLAARLRAEGLKPIRIRLRDVNIEKEFFTALGEAVAFEDEVFLRANARWLAPQRLLQGGGIFRDEVPFRGTRICPYVMILDGWDEISIAVSEGFKQRVKELLMNLRREVLARGPMVRVILTGRPSDAVDGCTDFFMPETPVLTVRPLKPETLERFADNLRKALEMRPIHTERDSEWKMPAKIDLEEIFAQYRTEFENRTGRTAGATSVLGIPFLAQLAFRVISGGDIKAEEVVRKEATLLRSLTDIAVGESDRPSDRTARTKVLQRITGEELRTLLRRTAAEMTIAGRENISREELNRRLKIDDLDEKLRFAGKQQVLTGLMVSFYFKGGNPALGCEFTHKAFREYLFAEELVETLKQYAKAVREWGRVLHEREPYWKDFEERDPRYRLVRDLANLTAPQWLTEEVIRYLAELLEWEIERSVEQTPRLPAGATKPINLDEWRTVRDGLADLWDWWGEGVHLRPQVKVDPETEKPTWVRPVIEKLIDRNISVDTVGKEGGRVPVRFTALDAHLGDALTEITARVHYYVAKLVKRRGIADGLQSRSRGQYQSLSDCVRFRPSGARPEYFKFYCARINSGGWYGGGHLSLEGQFPSGAFLRGTDLQGIVAFGCNFLGADLREANLESARLPSAIFARADLGESNLRNAYLMYAYLVDSNLADADLRGCLMNHAVIRPDDQLAYAKRGAKLDPIFPATVLSGLSSGQEVVERVSNHLRDSNESAVQPDVGSKNGD